MFSEIETKKEKFETKSWDFETKIYEIEMCKYKKALINQCLLSVDLQGVEPWSKQETNKLSTCLFFH